MIVSPARTPLQTSGNGKMNDWYAKPYCQCRKYKLCDCGEDHDVTEWNWEENRSNASWLVISQDRRQITFHPLYSSGTAVVRGDTPMLLNHQYYWEIKVLSQPYGTDIMVGVGTNKVNTSDDNFEFMSLLGKDAESYGLSYRGAVYHDAKVVFETVGFCRGTIVGVRLDMWMGTLEFYVNRKPLGVTFRGLRRHCQLFPMACSTAAQSSMKLTYAASWRASLLVHAAKILAASLSADLRRQIPPGLTYPFKSHFWLTLPSDGDTLNDDEEGEPMQAEPAVDISHETLSSGMKQRHWQMTQACVVTTENT
ncbi:SPRY domain-containing SOCS box protein 3-like isoform X2 [Leptidea sinapis]|uniref:SPRY domain-containing SOCS box protein 3-like isoform X2 n=1 Tax=Leptidea sinapis TaxID=189913 RepID=UPI00214592CF|nr:SPRY domain-containing SOCS box protein 3-like isoform X2 [Leptidea sinapis]